MNPNKKAKRIIQSCKEELLRQGLDPDNFTNAFEEIEIALVKKFMRRQGKYNDQKSIYRGKKIHKGFRR